MINELARFPTRPDVCFDNSEQVSIAVFTVVLYFTHTCEHRLIKLKLYNNWSAQTVNSVQCENQRNQSNFLPFKNWPINQRLKYMW